MALQRRMAACRIVVNLELGKLAFQITGIPEQHTVAQREVWRPLATTTKNDKLLLECEILSDHGSHATWATQLQGHNGEVPHGDQEFFMRESA
jgi:hypothetical protein